MIRKSRARAGLGCELFCMCENFKIEKQEIRECVPFVSLVGTIAV